jgi:hypothetical protein
MRFRGFEAARELPSGDFSAEEYCSIPSSNARELKFVTLYSGSGSEKRQLKSAGGAGYIKLTPSIIQLRGTDLILRMPYLHLRHLPTSPR